VNHLLSCDDLRTVEIDHGRGTTFLFDGSANGPASRSFIVGEYQPGCVARRHRHTYDEIFIINVGHGEYTVGEMLIHAYAGDTVLIPAGVWHSFRNVGDAVLRHTAIHGTGEIEMEFAMDERPERHEHAGKL
jgi:quercetin dioxygenase-like cupin family protein